MGNRSQKNIAMTDMQQVNRLIFGESFSGINIVLALNNQLISKWSKSSLIFILLVLFREVNVQNLII